MLTAGPADGSNPSDSRTLQSEVAVLQGRLREVEQELKEARELYEANHG